jgi:hypothetical protein
MIELPMQRVPFSSFDRRPGSCALLSDSWPRASAPLCTLACKRGGRHADDASGPSLRATRTPCSPADWAAVTSNLHRRQARHGLPVRNNGNGSCITHRLHVPATTRCNNEHRSTSCPWRIVPATPSPYQRVCCMDVIRMRPAHLLACRPKGPQRPGGHSPQLAMSDQDQADVKAFISALSLAPRNLKTLPQLGRGLAPHAATQAPPGHSRRKQECSNGGDCGSTGAERCALGA